MLLRLTKTKQMHTSDSKHNINFSATEAAKNTGIVLMTLAATLGMVELPDHPNSKIVVNAQPVFAFATNNVTTENTATESKSSQRREREEAGPHYVSYSAAQRTPGRTGRI